MAGMQALKRRVDGGPITMLTHSAGGWLGRVYMLDFGSEVRGIPSLSLGLGLAGASPVTMILLHVTATSNASQGQPAQDP